MHRLCGSWEGRNSEADETLHMLMEGIRIVLAFWIERRAGAHLPVSRLAADHTVRLVDRGYVVLAAVRGGHHVHEFRMRSTAPAPHPASRTKSSRQIQRLSDFGR